MSDKELVERNTALEAATLLAQRDVETLRRFIGGLLPRYGDDSMLLTAHQLDAIKQAVRELSFPCISEAKANQVAGALKAIGMGDEAEYMMESLNAVRQASRAASDVCDIIDHIMQAETKTLRAEVYRVQDETGGEYTRTYANIGSVDL